MKISGVELIVENDMVCRHQKQKGKPFEQNSLALWAEATKSGIALDIGAYTGIYAIKAALSGAQAWAFEPNRTVFDRLKLNAANNNVNLTAINVGVGSKIGTEKLNIKFPFTSAGNFCNGDETGVEEVNIITIDSLNLTDVTAIKIDVEGYECEVLKGAIETINRCKPIIITEILTETAMIEQAKILTILGYTGEHIDERNMVWKS